MACTWELMFNMQQYRESGLAAAKAMQLIDNLESQLTIYDEDSEVSELNLNAASEPFPVATNLFDCYSVRSQFTNQLAAPSTSRRDN